MPLGGTSSLTDCVVGALNSVYGSLVKDRSISKKIIKRKTVLYFKVHIRRHRQGRQRDDSDSEWVLETMKKSLTPLNLAYCQ